MIRAIAAPVVRLAVVIASAKGMELDEDAILAAVAAVEVAALGIAAAVAKYKAGKQ